MMNSPRLFRAGAGWRSANQGLSIVELMVGITIALFIVAGATLVLTTQLDTNRRLLLEAQLQQDLRAAADMISRDVRRAGYWGRSYCNIWPAMQDAAACPGENPYNIMVPANAAAPGGTDSLVYARSTDSEGAGFNADDGVVDGGLAGRPRERVGFRWNDTDFTIEYMVGTNNWQALTDKSASQVTQFNMVVNSQVLPVPCAAAGCQARGPVCNGPLTVQSRDITFVIVARAVHDPKVQRSLRENVRLRNSVPVEQCGP